MKVNSFLRRTGGGIGFMCIRLGGDIIRTMDSMKNFSCHKRPERGHLRNLTNTFSKSDLIIKKNRIIRVTLEPLDNIKSNFYYLSHVRKILSKDSKSFFPKLSPIQKKRSNFIEKGDEQELRVLL